VSSPVFPIALWALLTGGLAAGELAFWHNAYGYGLLAGVAVVTGAAAGLLARWRHRVLLEEEATAESYPVVLLAAGLTLAAVGAVFGAWLWLPGLGLAAAALGMLAHETLRWRRT
jgi:hypothetical protein